MIVNTGNCVIQNYNSNRTINNLTCYNASSSFPGFPDSGEPTFVPIRTSVDGLYRGSNSFSVTIENLSSDTSVRFVWKSLNIIDDLGNYYSIAPFSNHASGLSRTIPPGQKLRVEYTLSNPIHPDAKYISFSNDTLWAQPLGSQFSKPLQILSWLTNL
ncbi:MAG: hypothetical protein AB4372_15870 [Xenococcus sp. (in: cyanobacteria)]